MNIKLDGKVISLKLEKKNRKTISIKITRDGQVAVSAPSYLSNEKIHELIDKKAKWIIEKLELLEANNSKKDNVEVISFLGERYKVSIYNAEGKSIKVKLDGGEFRVYIAKDIKDRDIYVREALVNWYRSQAVEIYKERTEYYSKILNVCPKKITIKEQKTRWGSCSSKGNLNFNWKVVMAPMEIVNYLVVHELCHLIQMNHSKEFWKLVQGVLPNYKKYVEWLKVYGNTLSI